MTWAGAVASNEKPLQRVEHIAGQVAIGVTAEERFFSLLGSLKQYLDDPSVTNIEIGAGDDGLVFVDEFGKGRREVEPFRRSQRQALISWLASRDNRMMDRLHSRLQCDAPVYGSRVQAWAPDISDWTMVWRQHQKEVFTLERYVDTDSMTPAQYAFCVDAITRELNLCFAGNTDSGKTTLLNAGLKKKAEIMPHKRAIVVQDRREVRADGFRNQLVLMARVEQADDSGDLTRRYTYEFTDALEDALRGNIGFLCWGEMREERSAVGLMLAANTGTRGIIWTGHCETAAELPWRIEDLVMLAKKKPVPRMIAKLCQAVVFMEKDELTGRRYVVECGYVTGYANDAYAYEKVA